MQTSSNSVPLRLLGGLIASLAMSTASAQTDLITIEFNEDDQVGFDLWPGGIGGNSMSNQFGGITVDLTTNTSFAQPTNRGSMDGTPPGYSYQHLYEDLLHAFTPTGTLTIDFSGLTPNKVYTFTLYAWDPGTASGTHEWSVTAGTGVPSVIIVDWATPLVDNDTFALVFSITATATGTFQVDNTNGLAGSAINGFKLTDPINAVNIVCDPANDHSQGNYTKLDNSTLGPAVGVLSGLHLDAIDGPMGEFGYFLVSAGASANLAVSNGVLCLESPQGRYAPAAGISALNSIGQFDASGTFQSLIQGQQGWDVPTGLPSPPGGLITAGETWYFQMWYRDGQRSNFSNALSVQF